MSGVEWNGVVGGNHTMKWREGKLDIFLHARFPKCHGGSGWEEGAGMEGGKALFQTIRADG